MYLQLLLNCIEPDVDVISLEITRTALCNPAWKSLDKSLRAEDELTFRIFLALPCTGADIEHRNAGHALLEVGVTQPLKPHELSRLQIYIPYSITHLRDVHIPSTLFSSRKHPGFVTQDCPEPDTTHSAERTRFVFCRQKMFQCGVLGPDGSPNEEIPGKRSYQGVYRHPLYSHDSDSTAMPTTVSAHEDRDRNKRSKHIT
jgi:hypothetical protein